MACAAGGDATDVPDSGGPADTGSGTDSPSGQDAPHLDGAADAPKLGSDAAGQDGGATDGSAKDTGADAVADSPSDAGPDTATDAGKDSPADSAPDAASDAAPDAATDGSTCVPVTLNTGTNDGGACPAPVSGSCGMGDIAGFTPTWIPPSGYHQGLCTVAQIDDFYNDCLASGATTTTCDDEQAAAPDCFDCIFSTEGVSPYGPLIETSNGVIEVNEAGCIALLEPCNLTCAEEVAAASQCENTACEMNCPVSDSTTLDDFDTCEETAASCDPDGCDVFATEANCGAELTGASHPASTCVTATTFEDYYNQIVPVFCGP